MKQARNLEKVQSSATKASIDFVFVAIVVLVRRTKEVNLKYTLFVISIINITNNAPRM
jgi:hypothetical protein